MFRTSASSSTTRIVRGAADGVTGAVFSEAGCSSLPASGRNRLTVVPRPISDSIFTVPPDCFANPYTMLRPRPVPRPPVFVVKNGSNTRATTSGGMPLPVSLSAIHT